MDNASASHRRVQRSTTLNRKYVKKPVASEGSAAIDSVAKRRADDLKRRQAIAEEINKKNLATLKSGKSLKEAQAPVAPRPLSATIERSLINPATSEPSPREAKDAAVRSALKSVATLEGEKTATPSISSSRTFGAKKILLALGCAAAAVGIISYFVSVNTPDLSVRVAAMQSGIDAAYPAYVPRGYSLSDIVSEDKKLTMTFHSSSDNASFVLTEEKSAWDNETLESSYVKQTWGTNYTSVREQGITIYIAGSDAAWVNGGIFYKIDASGNNLTKKQLKSIVTSL